jgi:hypothetical protein
VSDEPVLTSEQAAELLQVNVETLRGLPIPYLTIGHGQKRPRRRYLRETVLAWAKTKEVA